MLNFVDAKLKPDIISLNPFEDGYSPTNLISEDPSTRKLGYLAYASIRPPVDINVNLICNVNLNHIIINARNNVRKSTAFELSLANKSSYAFNPVSQVYLDKDDEGVVFYNLRTFVVNDKIPQNYKVIPMKSKYWRLITSCEKFKIRILRADSIPCIGSIEVWGNVSKTCSRKVKIEVYSMYYNRPPSVETFLDETPPDQPKEILSSTNFDFPEEFLDALTFEIMSIPMTLPSGNTIDKSTLEKHDQSQDIWCRKPFDPFTGQTYTTTCKPMFNAALKSRIDQFLVINSNHDSIKNIPRTVGRKVDAVPNFSNKRTFSDMTEMDDTDSISLDNNLDVILNKTMSKLKRFTPITNEISCCFECKLVENLYKLTCGHLFCRQCLIKITDTCSRCNQLFKKCDIMRYHC